MTFKRWKHIVGICLLISATTASALSLGRVRGTALLGRSLDILVQGSTEAQEPTPEASCFSAELFYGDTRVSPVSISLNPERSAGGELRIRIRSSVAVDEPVVTLFLRATCGASVSRRFVLLTEAVTEAETGFTPFPFTPSASPAPAPAFRPSSPPANASAPPTSADTTARVRSDVSARATAARQARQQARELAAQKRLEARAQDAASNAVGVSEISRQARSSVVRKADKIKVPAPRLQLDLLDLSSASVNLRSSAELSSAPSSDEAVRRQAQALWRTLNASPEDILRDSQRLEKAESQLRAALDQSKRHGQDVATLSTDLQVAKRERYLNPLVYALAVLALAALAACIWLWKFSSGNSKPWWGSASEKSAPKDEAHLWGHLADSSMAPLNPGKDSVEKLKVASRFDPVQTALGRKAEAQASGTGVLTQKISMDRRAAEQSSDRADFSASSNASQLARGRSESSSVQSRGDSRSSVDSSAPSTLSANRANAGKFSDSRGFSQSDFVPSMLNGGARIVAAEELFDIQEQADFFMSLDQPEQAIEVLKNHITDNVETSALAYMDLFDIYHRTNRQDEYTQLRDEFNRVFNAQVPEFSRYGGVSVGLEGYPHVLESIQDVWSKPQQALEMIEESIFRQPDQDRPPLDMLAYRELMLLYAMSRELAKPGAYSMLPKASQTDTLPVIAPLGVMLEAPDFDLGDEAAIDKSTIDLLAHDDATFSLPPGLSLIPPAKSEEDNSLDFDVSDFGSDDGNTLPGFKKKS